MLKRLLFLDRRFRRLLEYIFPAHVNHVEDLTSMSVVSVTINDFAHVNFRHCKFTAVSSELDMKSVKLMCWFFYSNRPSQNGFSID